jgi:excisionase family DNA binding protein
MKRGGIKKGRGGRPPGKKPASADVDESAVMTPREVAEYLHCHQATVTRLVQRGEIPGFKMRRDWRFLRSEIDQWIASGGGRRRSAKPVKPGPKARKPKPASKKPRRERP